MSNTNSEFGIWFQNKNTNEINLDFEDKNINKDD